MTTLLVWIVGFGADLLIGDPQWRWHPVRLVGHLATWLEVCLNQGQHRRAKGILFWSLVVGMTVLIVSVLLKAATFVHPWAGAFVSAVLIYFALAVKCLADEAGRIAHLLSSGNLDEARRNLAMIVGRDTAALDESGIIRATVETVAESTMDGIVAPLFFLFLAGPAGMWFYKAVNTLDSLVGHKNARYREFGWVSATVDAWLNWIPSKITAILISLSFGFSTHATGAWRWTGRHLGKGPEYNGDTAEAAMAGGLGVRLGGVNVYNSVSVEKPFLGDDIEPLSIRHIDQSIRISCASAVGMLFIAVLLWGKGMIG
jgi:adenosylcobinamide-phosphate synthase